MAKDVAPEFVRFVSDVRRTQQLPAATERLTPGAIAQPIVVEPGRAAEFLRVAARRAAGLFRPTRRNEVVWIQGDSELAVSLTGIDIKLAEGFIIVIIPVRTDQTGEAGVEVAFAVGRPDAPAGMYASAFRRPNGPRLIVEAWGEALIAFAWQCVLGMVSGIAGATGKDARGNVLVPAEMVVTANGIQIMPMARHRFAGSSELRTKPTLRPQVASPAKSRRKSPKAKRGEK